MININELLGVPFIDSGRDYRVGLDCWGMVMEVFRRQGITLPDYRICAFNTQLIHSQMEEALPLWTKVAIPTELTVVGFAIDPHYPQFTQHFGVCLDKRKFIHTRKYTGGVIEEINSPFWSRKIMGYWKWQG